MSLISDALAMSGGGAKGDNIIDLIQSTCPYFAEIPLVGEYCLRHYVIKDLPQIGLAQGSASIVFTKDDTGKAVEISENAAQINHNTLLMSAFCKNGKILWFTTQYFFASTEIRRYYTNGMMFDHTYGYEFDFENYTSDVNIITTNYLECRIYIRGSYTYQRDFYYDDEWHHYDNIDGYYLSTSIGTSVNPTSMNGWSTLTVDEAFQELKNFWKEVIKYY